MLKSAVRVAAREIPSSKTMRRSAMKAGKWAMRRVGYDPGPDYGSMALRGLGAAAVTLPIGYLIGRRLLSHPTTTR